MGKDKDAFSAAEKIYGSNYHVSATGFRGVGFNELVDLFKILLNKNSTKEDVEHLFENHPATISMSRSAQESSCPEFNEECDCFLPHMKNGEIWCQKRKRERIESSDRRNYPEYKKWRTNVFQRDKYTCKECGVRGGELNAHHIKPYKNNKTCRVQLSNGITLCKECHKKEHRKGSKNGN